MCVSVWMAILSRFEIEITTVSERPNIERPILVPYAKFRWDRIRSQHQIVYPEGILVVNDSGASILQRCDGRLTSEIIRELNESITPPADVADDVYEFLRKLDEKGLLCESDG